MVLCLPVLLFVMALMINVGAVAAWRVRDWSVARHSAWAGRHPRSGATRPGCWWPSEATMNGGGMSPLAIDDSALAQPVVRGPLPLGTVVRDDVLDATRGGRHGSAALVRQFPMLARLGAYQMHATEELLDREWQHREMGIWTTFMRRMPVIYKLAQADPAFQEACLVAAASIVYAPFRPDLFPLDRDDEFIAYSRRFAGSATFPYHGAPDFHPVLHLPCGGSCRDGCSTDPAFVRSRVEDVVDRIQGNPERRIHGLAYGMTRAFIRLYEAVQEELARQIQAEPPPSPAEVAALRAEIDQLQQKIDVLQQFQQTLN